MFWISGKAVVALRDLKLRQADFEDEASHSEESLSHAGERLFIPVARNAGLAVGLLPVDDGEILVMSAPRSHWP